MGMSSGCFGAVVMAVALGPGWAAPAAAQGPERGGEPRPDHFAACRLQEDVQACARLERLEADWDRELSGLRAEAARQQGRWSPGFETPRFGEREPTEGWAQAGRQATSALNLLAAQAESARAGGHWAAYESRVLQMQDLQDRYGGR